MKGLVPIMVDCTKGNAHDALMKQFNVTGFPTAIFIGPDGKEVARLRDRSPGGVKQQVEEVVRQHTRPTLRTDLTVEAGVAAAREARKLLAVFFADDRAAAENGPVIDAILAPALEQLRGRFVWVKRPLVGEKNKATDEAKAAGARKSPTLVLIDPWAEPGSKPLKKLDAWKALQKELEKAVDAAQKAGHPPAPGAPTPPPGGEGAKAEDEPKPEGGGE